LINDIIYNLEKIYSSIPDFKCKHCHQCCGPIIWFEPEEILIKSFLLKNKIERLIWSLKDFEKNKMRCPYLRDDRCIIYPVRPLVCRLQGNISELKCNLLKTNKKISKRSLNKIRDKYVNLIKQTNGMYNFYSNLKLN
jgi:Fe-S-cluster containining protein